MKKPKISLDSAKIQTFLLNHVEKVLLVVVIGLMLLLIWQGFSLTGLESGKTPQGLLTKSKDMMQFIDDPNRWQEVEPTRLVSMDVVKKVVETQFKSDPQHYFLQMALSKPDFPKLSPRTDPTPFPPIHLVVHAVVGPVASLWRGPGDNDALLPPPGDEERTRPTPTKPKPLAKRPPRGGEGLAGSAPGMLDSGTPVPPRRGSTTKKGKGESALYAPGVSEDSAGMPGHGYGMGGAGMNGELYQEALTVGYPIQNAEATIARNTHAVVLMAVVPLQKQMEEYDKALASSLDYEPNRDSPQYLQFWVQRAEVTDDPQAAPDTLTWTRLNVNAALEEQLGKETPQGPMPGLWAGWPTEVVDPYYVDSVLQSPPGTLTHPAPPFLQRDLWDLLTHPDVPLATMSMYGYGEGMGPVPPGATAASAAPSDDLPTASMRPGMGAGMGGYGGATGTADGGYGGTPRFGGYGGRMPGGGEGSAMYGGTVPRGGYTAPAMGGYQGAAGGYGGYGGYGMGQPVFAPPKYKLIRFTDTTVEPGKKYRYRLKVFLQDPNHPQVGDPNRQILGYLPPSSASLAPDVQKRVKELDAADKKTGKPTFWVQSDWSEPSPVAELPQANRILAVKVTPTPMVPIQLKDRTVPVPGDQPKATALAVLWDGAKAADIPIEVEKVGRGTVFNFFKMKEVKVIHPVTKQVVTIPEEYSFATDALVADIAGGEKIPALDKSTEKALTAPGELLIFDPAGNLHVQNETDDIEIYRRFAVRKPETTPTQPGATDGLAPGYETGSADGGTRGRPSRPPPRSKTACF